MFRHNGHYHGFPCSIQRLRMRVQCFRGGLFLILRRMNMPELTPFTGVQGHPLRQPIIDMIMHKYRQTPRHLQRELGPSEIGEECTRKLAQNIMHERVINEGDPWPSIVGTATHTWMDSACHLWNEHIGRVRFLPEQEVMARDGLPGHCDCLDVDTLTVIDWKNVGTEP